MKSRGLAVFSGSSEIHTIDRDGNFILRPLSGSSVVFSGSLGKQILFDKTRTSDPTHGLIKFHGAFRIPVYSDSADRSLIEALAGAGLGAGTYNGQWFYLDGAYEGSDEGTSWWFHKPNSMYFCRNKRWFADPFVYETIPEAGNYSDRTFDEAAIYVRFQNAWSWGGTIANAEVSEFSNFSSPDFSLGITYENAQSWPHTIASVALGNLDSPTLTAAYGFTNGNSWDGTIANAEVSEFSNFSSPDASATINYESSQSWPHTIASVALGNLDSPTLTTAYGFTNGNSWDGTIANAEVSEFSNFSSPEVSHTEDFG